MVSPAWNGAPDETVGGDIRDVATVALCRALEIAQAMHIPIVPILLHGAMGSWRSACATLAEASTYPAIELRHIRWNDDIARVVERLEWILSDPGPLGPVGWEETQSASTVGRIRWRIDHARRRVIPRTRYWRLLKRIVGSVLGVVALALAFQTYRFVSDAPRRNVERIAGQLSYARRAVDAASTMQRLEEAVAQSRQRAVGDAAAAALRSFLQSVPSNDEELRQMRGRAFDALKRIRANDIATDLAGVGLKGIDMAGADLSSANLRGVNLQDASVEGVNFTNAILIEANLSKAFARNANFIGATLAGANIADLDWYNAKGVSEPQLLTAIRTTVRKCPKDATSAVHTIDALRKDYDDEYDITFENLDDAQKRDLTQHWTEYTMPGGLCERRNRW